MTNIKKVMREGMFQHGGQVWGVDYARTSADKSNNVGGPYELNRIYGTGENGETIMVRGAEVVPVEPNTAQPELPTTPEEPTEVEVEPTVESEVVEPPQDAPPPPKRGRKKHNDTE